MKVGLIRHFEVDLPVKLKLTSEEFNEWVKQYDSSKVKKRKSTIDPTKWDKCYCSDLPRAIETAQHIYDGEIYKTEMIREVPLGPIIKTKLKFSHMLWLILGRLAWLFSHKSQTESKHETYARVSRFVSEIEPQKNLNILVVSHGFIMRIIKRELIRRGFKGVNFEKAEYGKLYTYER